MKKFINSNGENKISIEQLIELSKTNNSIAININTYYTCLEFWQEFATLEPTTDRGILQTGHYASLGKMKIFVDKIVPANYYLEEHLLLLK